MKVYLAGPYVARDLIREYFLPVFVERGHVVTSGWLGATHSIGVENLGPSPATADHEVAEAAWTDLEHINLADAVVHFNSSYLIAVEPSLDNPTHVLGSGGRHVETGYALALGKPVVVVGQPENIFQRGLCRIVPGLHEALDALRP